MIIREIEHLTFVSLASSMMCHLKKCPFFDGIVSNFCGSFSQPFIFKIIFPVSCLLTEARLLLKVRKCFVPVHVLGCKQ